jgi:membrane-associated phospholipid phosphatase
VIYPDFGKDDSKALLPLVALAILGLLLIPVHLVNARLFLLLNGQHSPLTDTFWLTVTTVGDGLYLGIVMGAFVVKNPRLTALGLMLIVLSGIAVHVLKASFPTPRPAEALGAIHVVGPLLRSGSFPSGHTASAISAALAVWYCHDSRVVGWLAMSGGVLIALSRIFVGAHFPQDAVGGAICALTCFVLIHAFVWPALEPRIPDRPDLHRKSFRVAVRLEVIAAAFALMVWSPLGAESPAVGLAVSVAVLAFVGHQYGRLTRENSER